MVVMHLWLHKLDQHNKLLLNFSSIMMKIICKSLVIKQEEKLDLQENQEKIDFLSNSNNF
jgi:hypothetical protein